MLIVMKFGGTSVGSAERIAQAAQLAVDTANKGHQVVVVTSAMSKVTDSLIAAARQASTGPLGSEDPAGALRSPQGRRRRAGRRRRRRATRDVLDALQPAARSVREALLRSVDGARADAAAARRHFRHRRDAGGAARRRGDCRARQGVAGGRRDRADRHDRPVRRRRAADGRDPRQDRRAPQARWSPAARFRSSPGSSARPPTA